MSGERVSQQSHRPCFCRYAWLLVFIHFLFPPRTIAADNAEKLRIVSLAPNLTELIFDLGLGSTLVGRSSACNYPTDVTNLPPVGDFGRPHLEPLLAVRPHVVLTTDLEQRSYQKLLAEAGIRLVFLPCESFSEIADAAVQIATLAGQPLIGEKWAKNFLERAATVSRSAESYWQNRPRPRIYVEIWHRPLTTAGGRSFLDEIISIAGGTNVAHHFSERYPHVSSEWVISQDPDVILIGWMLPYGDAATVLRHRVGWDQLRAVRENSVCQVISPELLTRPGPRTVEAAQQLAEWLIGWDLERKRR